jgi:hypothetical protein
MNKKMRFELWASAALAVLVGTGIVPASPDAQVVSVYPAKMPRMGTVNERFQSFNIEMVEVTGGRFWKPYGAQVNAILNAQPSARQPGSNPVGLDPALFQYRPPIDLANPRLRKLAAGLGPAYVRVSGTWANTTYFLDSDTAPPPNPPEGFNAVLTRRQWKGVVEFSNAVDAKIVTSFATSPGTRDAGGVWTPKQARQLLAYTQSLGGNIAAAEFMNEPNFAKIGGAPKGYDAAAYARDLAVFVPFIRHAAPEMVFLGPGSVTVGEGGMQAPASLGILDSEDLLQATGPVFDAFSYHFYGAVSQRCVGMGGGSTTAAAALSPEWLSRTERAEALNAGLRDKFEPGKPLWLTETGEAACGGNPWASTFLDTFRYLIQHGRLAQRGVQVIAHNTLASSDYGLVDENTLAPRPNYWAALFWRKLMGATVLNPGASLAPNLHLYAHCLRGHPGGVALLVINADRTTWQELAVPTSSDRYTLTARDLLDTTVQLNGNTLRIDANGTLPPITGEPISPGLVRFAPASITFLGIPNAGNSSCQ